jgi:hypothetical protein
MAGTSATEPCATGGRWETTGTVDVERSLKVLARGARPTQLVRTLCPLEGH